ncbi:MAG TPA: GLPGLI family protein [Sediminibacterium sp.]|nr:GLPGLI family protein [Sediminibacterium sp.]
MKSLLFFVIGLSGTIAVSAQIKAGTITYEQKINLHRTIQDEQMKAMLPEFRTGEYLLLFSDSISLYKQMPEDEAPDPFASSGGARIMFRVAGGGGDLYKNLAEAKSIQVSEIGGKNFLITDSIRQQPWKLDPATKTILGYTCHKATRKIMQGGPMMRRMIMNGGETKTDTSTQTEKGREVEVVAWYADELLSPTGPENYGQLPGVILELNVDNGATVYTAKEVKKTVDTKELKEPKKGKQVTRQEFMKIMSEMMPSGGGARTIRFGA